MRDVVFVVYCHVNKKNGKRYVGWTATSVQRRWSVHCKSARAGSRSYFHTAIRKYGSGDDAWDHLVVTHAFTARGAKLLERLWISYLHTFAYDKGAHGYNETRGGDGMTGHQVSVSTRRRLSECAKRENLSPETLKKMSDAQRRRKWGPRSEQTKRRIADGNKGKANTSVAQYTMELQLVTTYPSVRDAASSVNGHSAGVSQVARGIWKTYKGFVWKYVTRPRKWKKEWPPPAPRLFRETG